MKSSLSSAQEAWAMSIAPAIRAPRFSPDGRWVAYSSSETGQSEI